MALLTKLKNMLFGKQYSNKLNLIKERKKNISLILPLVDSPVVQVIK